MLATICFTICLGENVDKFIALAGALTCAPIQFLFPALFHLLLIDYRKKSVAKSTGGGSGDRRHCSQSQFSASLIADENHQKQVFHAALEVGSFDSPPDIISVQDPEMDKQLQEPQISAAASDHTTQSLQNKRKYKRVKDIAIIALSLFFIFFITGQVMLNWVNN